MERIFTNRYAILCVGTISMLMYGIIYAWSIFIPPLEAEFGWSRASTSLVFSVSMIGLSLGMISVGLLLKKTSIRKIFILASILVAFGLFGCRFVHEPWQLYLIYGVCCGYGAGLAYTSWTTSVLAWFGDKAGFASGVLVMGFGMGTIVLGGAATLLIYSSLGWRTAFAIIGIAVFIWSIIAMFFMNKPPEKIASLHPKHDDINLSLNPKQVATSSSFWIFCMWRSLFMGAVAAIISQVSVIMTGIGASIATASIVVGAIGLGNGLGRPVGGIVYDRLGQQKTLVLLPTLGLIVALGLLISYHLSQIALCGVLILALGFVYGMYSAINTSFMRTTYGQTNLATNTGISAIVLAPFNLIFPLIAACIFQSFASYDIYFMIIPICAAASITCAILSKSAIARLQERYKEADKS